MLTTDVETQPVIGSDYPKILVPLIKAVQHSIDIIMYEWKWYSHENAGGVEHFNLAILGAARRGVKIRVLMDLESSGHPITRINKNTESKLKAGGVQVKYGSLGNSTHAKMLIFDGASLVLGSHNISKGSFTKNQECSIQIKGGLAIRPFIDYFDLLWSNKF